MDSDVKNEVANTTLRCLLRKSNGFIEFGRSVHSHLKHYMDSAIQKPYKQFIFRTVVSGIKHPVGDDKLQFMKCNKKCAVGRVIP